ncbi:pyridine nucleotide-disulfide oxidoreductase domain-containing protein 1 [Coccinella septempunctata]|uniref:pyridine nucleotide-disulfide oxidoreductase domain-containing protein 1 n=1 Tax=Coccinella septempunctata TaxID=41139 RepID=UPI001D0713E5|nr:pyridine nucleotide-disulfide oxidoreductase domain-containing protein 1 [Coccinella septempunctata]
MEATFVIIGGGIAGVSCAESLSILDSDNSVILLSESALIKTATNVFAITRTLTSFEVKEDNFDSFISRYPNVKVIHDTLEKINEDSHTIKTKSQLTIKYRYLCLCTGATPKLIPQANNYPEILGIRDTDSVELLVSKLSKSKRIAIVGNGGIATELIYQIKNVETHWIIKDKHISATFVDPGAAEFFNEGILENKPTETIVCKRIRYNEENVARRGAALGPDWYKNLNISGSNSEGGKKIIIHYEVEVKDIHKEENGSLELILTNNEKVHCDLVVSATGVCPNLSFTCDKLQLSKDGFINVDEFMRTSVKDVYAAGDVCNANWEPAKHWFQMKLWTQARHMGCYAAKSMYGALSKEEVLQDFCFEIFSHSTKLFGFKVILLGLFNGQKLGTNYEILLRMTKKQEYVKFVLENNKLQGAILIGDTDLEEMCENLILNQLDLSPFGDDILNPDIDIEDYFD